MISTVDNYLRSYLPIELYRNPLTVKNQRLQLGLFLQFYSNKRPSEITIDDCRSFVRFLVERELLPQTINKYISTLKSFFDYCILEGYTGANPALRLHAFREEKRIVVALTKSELYEVINCKVRYRAARKRLWERDHLLMMLIATTGLRTSEVCKIKWEDVNFEEQSLYVRPTVGKGSKARQIYIINETASLFFNYYESIHPDPNNYLFYGVFQNHPITPRTVNDIFKRILATLNITRFKQPRVYLLRKSYITHLIRDGVNIESVSSLAGHSSPAITWKYYKEAETFENIKQEVDSKYFMNHSPKSNALLDYQKRVSRREGYVLKNH